jgi:hypothetical protein
MFYCEHCGKLVECGQPTNKIITSFRQKTYQNQVVTRKQEKEFNIARGDFFTTYGREIEKEINVCPKCCIALTGRKPNLKKEISSQQERPKQKDPDKRYTRQERQDNRRKPEVSIVTKLPIIK